MLQTCSLPEGIEGGSAVRFIRRFWLALLLIATPAGPRNDAYFANGDADMRSAG
jgi:hypothetical protein